MVIKMPKPTKADLIRGLLSYWDPLAFEDKAGPMFYNYEAEILAQSIRKNSKPENVAKKVRELIEEKMRVEGVNLGIDSGSVDRIAIAMIQALKNM
ncbi:MAG: hypothetical protein IKS55_15075 [Oscillospiraceae bacterium]|nr:hypothetical protein [Oscillospiraceae bacterium]